MNISPSNRPMIQARLSLVRELVSRHYGFWVKDDWMDQLRLKVAQRMQAVGAAEFAAYWQRLQSPDGPATELQELVEEILNHESQFNRNLDQLALFKNQVLLDWRHESFKKSRRIASLGCSTGEEAYSLAILTEQVLGAKADEVLILGMDVSRRALAAARQARYTEFRIRDVPEQDRARCFLPADGGWQVHPRLQHRVRFLQHNLMQPLPANFLDVIFCCNVLIYFPTEMVRALIRQFHAALKPHGHLFLGHADSFVPRPDLFQSSSGNNATCYVRRPASEMNPATHSNPQRINPNEPVFK